MRSLAVLLALVLPGVAWALPNEIFQEGLLLDRNGLPLQGAHDLRFRFYDRGDAGNVLFEETHDDVELFEGYYALGIGSRVALNGAVFAVDGGAELKPRIRLRKVPAAFQADVAVDAVGDIHPRTVSVGGNVVIDADGRWTGDPTGLRGPAGPAGPQGPQGPAGPAGGEGSPDTPQQVRDKLKQADGTGSGVDADLLDGVDSTGFVKVNSPIDAATLQGQPAAAFVRTPQQVLDRLTDVDGEGSGVDADRLDGLDSTQFVRTAAQILAGLKSVDGAGSGVDADRLDGLDSTQFVTTAQQILDLLKTVDGSGSGVDADRLDGLDST
jgi:hypothetical protein